jgi:hypothetical protein
MKSLVALAFVTVICASASAADAPGGKTNYAVIFRDIRVERSQPFPEVHRLKKTEQEDKSNGTCLASERKQA